MDERDVEAVNPHHRLVGLVVVTVEMPTRGEQEVTTAHRDRIPVDHRPHPLALDDETEGVLAVTVLRRRLLGAQVLNRRPQRRRHIRNAAQAGVTAIRYLNEWAPSDPIRSERLKPSTARS